MDDSAAGFEPAAAGEAHEPAPPRWGRAGRVAGNTRVAAVGVVVTLGAGIASALIVSGPSDAARASTALAGARRFAGQAKTVHFSSQAQYEFAPAGNGFGGNSFNVRVNADGEIAFPDSFRILERQGDGVSETIVVGKKVFHRQGGNATDLLGEKWIDLGALLERVGPDNLGRAASSATALETLPALLRPSELLNVIRAARRPAFLHHRHHVTRLRAPVGLGRFHGEAKNLSQADTELWVRDDGTVERVSIRFRGRSLRGTVTYDFRLWRRPVVIAAPTGAQVDVTPGVDEEAIAKFKDTALFQPHGIPAGWVLDGAGVLDAADTDEGCPQVEVDYTDPNNDEGGYLDIVEFPATCLKGEPPSGAVAFTAGAFHGWVHDADDERVAQIQVGTTIVRADSDLTPGDLAIILSQLDPLDVSRRPVALPQIASPRPAQ